LIYLAWQMLRDHHRNPSDYMVLGVRLAGFVLLIVGGCGLTYLELPLHKLLLPHTAGGIIGSSVARDLYVAFNPAGTILLLLAILLSGITLLTGLSWLNVTEVLGRYTLLLARLLYYYAWKLRLQLKGY